MSPLPQLCTRSPPRLLLGESPDLRDGPVPAPELFPTPRQNADATDVGRGDRGGPSDPALGAYRPGCGTGTHSPQDRQRVIETFVPSFKPCL